ncbi:FAD-dependent monooxygenase [Haloarcula litorea]|uniref:FAD-dependent monooxygenase n=1 Tax=Haloarcula litorea TaxID=3032579 RepID=UPI0023E76D8A|nr:FAD-dependent monooxygenase [Halomicroarcula sp. GDY20]
MVARTVDTDVAVVGCGPGGAVLAYLLARSGVAVTLLERASTFQREYRGFGWNPGVVRLFDEMDLLDDVLALAHETVTEGAFSLGGRRVPVLAFDRLATEYPYALLMEQPAILEALVDHADAHETFTFRPATTVTDLLVEDGRVRGVRATDREADAELAVEARVVVGADGRYSTVRERAGIDAGAFDSPIDLAWFKLPAGAVAPEAQGRIDRHGVVLYFGLGGGDLQAGSLLRDGEWAGIRDAGFGAFRDRVAAVDPALAAAVDAHLDGFRDVTLLDVAPGIAPTWTDDGLLLLGDAAHTASPIGAQGNPLAVEDAVVAHDVLVGALGGDDGVLSASSLAPFENRRRATVERVIALQRRTARGLAAWLDYGHYVPSWVLSGAGAAVGLLAPRSGLVAGAVESFALGDRSVSVARRHFVD